MSVPKYFKMTSSNYINENEIEYLDYSEFQNIIEIDKDEISAIRKANWTKHNTRIVLKRLNPKEFMHEIKQLCKVNYHPNINHLLGTTKDPLDNEYMVLEYANEGNLREYLNDRFPTLNWRKKMEMALDITQGLMCLHSENIIHRNLHAGNILVNDGKLKIASLAYSTQPLEDIPMSKVHLLVEYTDPKYLIDPLTYKLDIKSDIYSLSILLWELSSGYSPYSKFQQSDQLKYDIINGLREESVGNTPIKYQQLYQKCWEQDPDQRLNISEVFEILNQLKFEANIDDTAIEKDDDDQEIIQKLKLNHGLFLYGCGMQPSKQPIYDDNGELDISLYDGQPLVYTNINDKPYDACINFPFAEITYKGNLLDTFLNYDDMNGKLNDCYGHFYSEKVFVGGQLFIKDFNATQIHFLKMHLNWAYHLTNEENQSCNFINLKLEPKIETWDRKEITTTEKLVNWMKKIYQENVIDVISYINPIPVSQLKVNENNILPTRNFRDFNEKILKVTNYEDRLNLDEWAKDSVYANLNGWINDFNLFQGLIINKNFEIEISKKVIIGLIKYPYLESKDNFHLKFKEPTNKLEKFLTSNNISSIKKTNSPIFNNKFIMNNDELKNYENNFHFIINYEQYEVLLLWDQMLLSKEVKQDIKKAIENTKPYEALQVLFDEYGYLFPQSIILGKSFKYISTKSSLKFEEVYPKISAVESLKSYLKNLEIPYLLTQKGEIEIDDLPDFIQQNKEDLEIIEYGNVITLHDMLQQEQRKQIDLIFEEDYKIIMVGINDLKDLNNDDTEHYKRISINPPLKDQSYEVFGSIISKKPTLKKLKEFSVKFRLYDFKGFTAIIKNLETHTQNFEITECYILWMIVGKPPKLSVFSPKNREFHIIYINESVLLQPDKSYYEIKTPFQLSQGYMISINAYHPPINDEPTSLIEFVKWSHNSIIFHSDSILKALSMNENEVGVEHEDNLLIENFSIELHICILFSDFKKLKVDDEVNEENEYPLDFIGNILTKETFIEYSLNTKNGIDNVNECDLNSIVNKIIDFLLNEKIFTFDERKRAKVILENHITQSIGLKNMLDWLLDNQSNPNNIFLLGYFYCFIIKTSEMYKKAFNLFYSITDDKYVILHKAANNLAKYYTGICYLNGLGIQKSIVKAFKYFEQLSNENYADGMVMLGYCYINGIGIEINKKKAYEFYKRAADKENVYAQNKLGLLYKSGIGIKEDLNEAIYWINKSAKNKSIDGRNILSTLYVYSKNIEIDAKDSFSQVKKEENTGDIEACYNLGKYYEYGIGVEEDKNEAFNYYKKAAEKEHLKASFKVGNFYYNGIGITSNKEEAFKYYMTAAKKKHKIAQNNLGILYENGEGTEKSLEQSIYWYQKAAENGYKDGYYNLGLCYEFKNDATEKNAFEFYKKAAEYENSDALFKLGNFYSDGIGVEVNDKEAFGFYKEAAIKGHRAAQNKLGMIYENGKGTKTNSIKACYWYNKSADSGYNLAYYNIGRCHEFGIGIEQNKDKAFKFYKKAAKKEHLDAIFKVAVCYSNGIGIEMNEEKAFEWYLKSAKNKNAKGQYNLAICYQFGKGTVKNLEEAFYWYQRAAEVEYIEAQYKLGYLYEKGNGTKKNLEKAFYWYKKAAENESKVAQYNLGCLYTKGEGTEKNLKKAFYWYQKAAENGYNKAQNNIGCLYTKGEGTEKNLERAFYWYQKAAENGNKFSQYSFGKCYEYGYGIEKDEIKAFVWYRKSAEQGYSDAQNSLGVFFANGKGTEKDLEKAVYWYQKAAESGNKSAQYNLSKYIKVVIRVIEEIIKIYRDAGYNKKICNSLMDRVRVAVIKVYYKTFVKFIDVMKKIKDFVRDISQLRGYKKFLYASTIKDKFNDLVEEFETIMKDFNFPMIIANEGQSEIDQQALMEDIAEMTKFLEKVEGGIVTGNNQINPVLQEVESFKDQLDHFTDIPETIKATKIDPNELMDPPGGKASDRRGKREPYIVKKFYKTSIEVACFPTTIIFQARLAIWEKLRDSPNILKFYGLSHVDCLVMVLEWAEYGNLREVYNNYDIAWTVKVSIALEICRGIIFLHSCSILHQDIRCANIMMTSRLAPKLTSFRGDTYKRTNLTEIIHWLAPEILRNAGQQYNTKCEIFSFGMLLWELLFEKIPYENLDMNRIKEHVLSNKREKITFGKESPTIQKLQQNYAKIIVSAWQDDPRIRASLQQIFLDLDATHTEFCSSASSSPPLKPDKSMDLDGSAAIITLDDGIAAHKRKEMQVAWECFNAHAKLGNTTAKYWKGYYLWEGYGGRKDRAEASKLFKEAADDGSPDAQLRYAFSLVGNPGAKFDKKVFIKYLIKAADNDNSTAQFNLGDLYINGKLGITKNEELGIKYLRLAALSNQPRAIEILTKLNINFK